MSAHQTWFGRAMASPRKRYGYILCPGAGFVVRRIAPREIIPLANPLYDNFVALGCAGVGQRAK